MQYPHGRLPILDAKKLDCRIKSGNDGHLE